MPTLQISITFLFFCFSILPHSISAEIADTACNELTCSADSRPWVRFPFRLKARQPSRCGYSKAFHLFCDFQSRAILTLPSSGLFVVQNIDYGNQNLWITDSCLPWRFLDGKFSLEGSPFSYVHALQNFTFLNCSSDPWYPIIDCLSNVNRLVTAVPSVYTVPSFCSVISTALVPLENPYEWNEINNFGLKLAWDAPNCSFCEAEPGNVCGPDINATSSKIICYGRSFSPPHNGPTYSSGLSRPKRYAIMTAFIGITGLTVVLALRLKNWGPEHQPVVVELSRVYNDPQPHYSQPEPQPDPTAKTELDDPTVDSSAKVYELGENKPSDSTCPICLGGYSPKDILRTISECNHYFHASCVGEWLRTNGTCPLCRKTTKE